MAEHLVRRTGVSQMKHRVRKSSRSDFAQADPPTGREDAVHAVQKRKQCKCKQSDLKASSLNGKSFSFFRS